MNELIHGVEGVDNIARIEDFYYYIRQKTCHHWPNPRNCDHYFERRRCDKAWVAQGLANRNIAINCQKDGMS